jgi:predicted amidohydrolase YtcJ
MKTVFLGTVVTMDPAAPRARGVAVSNGVIVEVLGTAGDEAYFCSRHQPSRLVRLEPGHVLLPGFVDPHSHMLGTGRNMMLCSLVGCENVAELLERVRVWIATHQGDKLVLGVSYDDTKLREMRHPTRSELDSVSASIVIVIQHVSGHVGVANTAAMTLETEHPELVSKRAKKVSNVCLTRIQTERVASWQRQGCSRSWPRRAARATLTRASRLQRRSICDTASPLRARRGFSSPI